MGLKMPSVFYREVKFPFSVSPPMYKIHFKRIFDSLLALLAVVILSPLMISISFVLFLINRKSGIFFVQQRTGLKAKPFNIYKFKTMADYRDKDGKLLPDEIRLTKFGKFVRSTSMDELPQLFNVLKGEMSLIGPRPLLNKYIPLYSNEQFRRHEVKPGITGWAQVNGRNAISWNEKFELDVWYVENISFALDLKIVFMTIYKIIQRKDISTANSATSEAFTGHN